MNDSNNGLFRDVFNHLPLPRIPKEEKADFVNTIQAKDFQAAAITAAVGCIVGVYCESGVMKALGGATALYGCFKLVEAFAADRTPPLGRQD